MTEPDAEQVGPTAKSSRRRIFGRVAVVGAIVCLLAIPVGARVGLEGRAELQLADEARDRGDVETQIVHLGRAARWRIPILSHDERAIERLVDLGDAAATRGDAGWIEALSAYREARRALLGTRTWGVPQPAVFERANVAIATIMAEQEAAFGTDVGGTGNPYAYHLALLETVPGPVPWRANLAALAFFGWVLAAGGFVVRAIDAKGVLRKRAAVRWGAAAIGLLIAWAMLLRFAG